MDAIVIAKLIDVVIVGLDALAAHKLDTNALVAEWQAAKAEGRPVNVQMFRDQAHAAQLAARQ